VGEFSAPHRRQLVVMARVFENRKSYAQKFDITAVQIFTTLFAKSQSEGLDVIIFVTLSSHKRF